MKNRFILSSLFLLGCTGLIQADSTPTLSRVYGDQFTAGIASTQPAGAIGQLVPTGVFGTNGSLVPSGSGLSEPQARAVQVLSDGTFVVALSASTSSVLTKYSSLGAIQTSAQFGTNGAVTLGAGTTENALAMIVDTQGRLLVSGGSLSGGTAGWLKRVSSDGNTVQTFDTTTDTPWRNIGGIAQQSSGKIIAVGFNGTNAQIGRYTIGSASAAGALDTATFGTSGFTILDGVTGTLPGVTTGLYSVAIDANNKIYVAFRVATAGTSGLTVDNTYIARFTVDGALDTSGAGGWPVSGFAALSALNSATSGLYLAKDVSGNFIVGAQVSPDIVVTGVTSAGAAIGSFTTFSTSTLSGTDTYVITDLMTTSDDKIFIVGSDSTTFDMAVIRLTGSSGALDTTFNTTGYNIFNISNPDLTSIIQGISVAPDGQLYTVGYQTVTGPTTTPYVSVLYNDLYVYEVAQDPATTEMGNLDLTFGTVAIETYAGVTTPFNGLYGPSLLQQANDVIEITTTSGVLAGVPAVGDMLVGMSGLTDSSASSSMMFSWLTSAGAIDTSINPLGTYPGYLTLTHDAGISGLAPNEYLTSVLQSTGGIVYTSGYASLTPGSASLYATLRAYSTAGTTTWTVGNASFYASESGAGYKGLAVGTQAFSSPTSTRILLFVQDSATTGHISGYTTGGGLDTGTFGLSPTGIIPTSNAAYDGLAMGPVYGGLVTPTDQNIVVAYKNSGSTAIDVAMFTANGSALQTIFNPTGINPGILPNVFSDATITLDNVRLGFIKKPFQNNFLVGAVTSNQLLLASVDPDGVLDSTFGSTGILTQPITGVTSLKLKEITGISDGTILATFYDDATDDTMYTARITAAGALDTTFNSQGSQPGVLPIQVGNEVADYNARIMTSALVQSTEGANQGNIVLAGYESVTSSDSTPMVMRSYGTPATTEIPDYSVADTTVAGTFAAAFDLNSVFGTSGGKVVYTYPAGNTYAGKMLVGVDNGTDSKIARIDVSSQTLDATFGTAGLYTITGKAGINSLTVDANNYILVGGTTSAPLGWAYQITPSATGGTPQVAFTMPSGILGVNQILQQKSGRYIVAANKSSLGVLIAFQDKLVSPATTLVVDPTFNPQATGAVPAGQCNVGSTTGLYTIAIDSNDTIAVAYAGTESPAHVYVGLFTANGSGYSTTLNTGGLHAPFDTTMLANNSSVARVAFDDQSPANIVVATSYNATTVTNQVQVARYVVSTGAIDAGFNSGAIQTISNLGTAGVVLADMMQTITQQTVLVGYNTAGGNGLLFAVRLGSDGELDATWNPTPTGTDTAGVLTYGSGTTPPAITLSDAAITINGNIVSVGSSNGTAGDPIITFVYGDSYVTEVAQQPLEAAAGTLDLTIPGGSTGAWSMTTIPAAAPQKIYIYNTTVNSSANGAMLIAASNGTNSYVTQLNSDLSVNSSNFATGSGTAGSVIIAKANLYDMFVANGTNDSSQPIYVTGDSGGFMWASKISSNGATTTTFTSAVSGSIGRIIRQTTNSRILVAGFNGANAVIYALKNDLSGLDLSFGTAGSYVVSGVTNQIYAMTIDQYDRIYIAYQTSGTNINVQRVLANGTALDTTFNTTGTQTMTGTAWSATQIRLVLDMTNDILTVVAQDGIGVGNILKVARFSTAVGTSGTAEGTANTMTIAGAVLNLSDVFVDTQTNPDLYVIGYNSTVSNSVVGRFTTTATTVTLDGTYAAASTPAGVANVDTHTAGMTVVTAGALDPDRRVYLVGTAGTATSRYMARLFGDVYTTEMTQATFEQIHGAIDLTIDGSAATPDGAIVLSTLTGWTGLGGAAGYSAKAIIANADGTSYIAFGNGTSLIVGKVTADMQPDTTFNTTGLTTSALMATVNNMSIDSLGNIFVAGTTAAGAQKVVGFSSEGALVATCATTLSSTVGTAVAQQQSGRYIVAGKIGTAGVISAYQNFSAVSTGTLPVDTTFGPASLNGYYSFGANTVVDDLVIDNEDYIYVVYRDVSGSSPYPVHVAKVTANGSGLVSTTNSPIAFNSGAAVSVGISSANPAQIAINSSYNIIVGASTTSGVFTGTYNGSTGAIIGGTTQQITATAGDVLTRLVGAGTGFYGSIYNTTPTIKVFHVLASGLLDITATAGGTGFGTSGVAIFTGGSDPETATAMYGITVQPDGKVSLVGQNNLGTLSAALPVIMRVYGYEYVPQFAQEPDQAAAGTLDTTLWPAVTDAIDFNTYFATTQAALATAISGTAIKRVYESGNGVMTFVADTSSATTIFQLNKDLTLNTSSFNSPTGFITFTGTFGGTTGLFIDSAGQMFVVGNNETPWLVSLSSVGATVINTNAFMGSTNAVSQQSSSRIIVAGTGAGGIQGFTNGVVVGLTSSGQADSSFGGVGGGVDMGSANAITDIAIDTFDNIITVSTAGTSGTPAAVVLQKVTDSGGSVATINAGTAVAGSIGNPKVVFDSAASTANIVVATATATGYSVRSYINNNTGSGSATGTDNAPAAVTITTGSSNNVLTNMYVTTPAVSGGNIVLVGYDSVTGKMFVARLISSGTPATSGAGVLTLDSTFNAGLTGSASPLVAGELVTVVGDGTMDQFYDAIVHADDRIMVVGSNSSTPEPYMTRVFGDNYVTYVTQAPTEAVPGTIDTTFGSTTPTTGIYDYSDVAGITANSKGEAILAVADGGYYMALTNGTNSQVIRTLAEGGLDTTYGGGDGIAAALTTFVANSMMMDGSSRLVLTSTSAGVAKVARYVSGDDGTLDTTFGTGGIVTITGSSAPLVGTEANVLVEQTLARYVVAGKNSSGAVLYAYTALDPSNPTTTGVLDTTFGGGLGYVQISSTNGIYNLIADQYDRLIFAVLNTAGDSVDLYRLTPTGELDTTFGIGTTGKVSVFTTQTGSGSGFDASSIHVAFDSADNIVVAAYVYNGTGSAINIAAYDNGTATTANTNGVVFTNAYAIPNLVGSTNKLVSLTALATTADGYVLVLGNVTGTTASGALQSPTWIARLANTSISSTYALDTAGFNPSGFVPGIFEYSSSLGTNTPYNVYNAMVVLSDGRLGVAGYEQTGVATTSPTVIRVNDTPYTTETVQSPNSKVIGTNDQTLGVSQTFYDNLGVTFFGATSSLASYGQVARAIALQDYNNIVVAVDGASSTSAGASQIFMTKFDTDGILNPSFSADGMATVLTTYAAQNVQDMVTFATVAGVNKAILAGYVTNSILGSTDSLLLQYNLASPGSLDGSFGGFNGNPSGVAFGDGKQLNSVARQTTGRIVAAGISQDDKGLLLGYTSAGKLDDSFGNDGYLAVTTTTGLYTHAIDTLNRVVIAYRNSGNVVVVARYLADGSGLDTSFGTSGLVTTAISVGASGNSFMRVALDSSNNIVLAAVTDGTTVTINSYSAANGTAGTPFNPALSLTAFTIARLLIDVDGKAVIVGSDTNGGSNDQVVIARTNTALSALDTTFNQNGTPGYLKYAVAAGAVQAATSAMIHPDGRILIIGSEN